MTEKNKRGGARPGAGRPRITDKPLATLTLRIPAEHVRIVKDLQLQDKVREAIARIVKRAGN